MKRAILFIILFLLIGHIGFSQHSPYFIYRPYGDGGMISPLHADNVGKFVFFSGYEVGYNPLDSNNIRWDRTFKLGKEDIEARVFYEKPWAYYFDEYRERSGQDPELWDHSKKPFLKYHGYVLWFRALKITINGEHVAWIRIASELNPSSTNEWFYGKRLTGFHFLYGKLGMDARFGPDNPLLGYFLEKMKTGKYHVEMEYYLMNFRASGEEDLAPEPFAKGDFYIEVDEAAIEQLKALNLKGFRLEDWQSMNGIGNKKRVVQGPNDFRWYDDK